MQNYTDLFYTDVNSKMYYTIHTELYFRYNDNIKMTWWTLQKYICDIDNTKMYYKIIMQRCILDSEKLE